MNLRKQLKQDAKTFLRDRWVPATAAGLYWMLSFCLLRVALLLGEYFLILGGSSLRPPLIRLDGIQPGFWVIALLVLLGFALLGPLSLGRTAWYLALARGKNDPGLLFSGFHSFEKFCTGFALSVALTARQLLSGILLLAPCGGLMLAAEYLWIKPTYALLLRCAGVCLGAVGGILWLLWIQRYAFVRQITLERPELSIHQALAASARITRGYRGELLKLKASFWLHLLTGLLVLPLLYSLPLYEMALTLCAMVRLRLGEQRTVTLCAPAKINLSLAVTGRREDGYHTLRSVMQSISLCDRVTVTAEPGADAPGIVLTCDQPEVPTDRKNTAYRAAEAFLAAAGPEFGRVTVHLEKHIPSQAGLGGASADAAGVLKGLNRLAGEPLSQVELEALGAAIGADVPFCLRGGCCLAEGIGEELTELAGPDGLWAVLVKPPFGCSTPEVFRRYDSLEAVPEQDTEAVLEALARRDWAALGARLFNGLEAAARPEIGLLRERLLALGALGSVMTGSGSVVYGLFGSRSDAEAAAVQMAYPAWVAELIGPERPIEPQQP